MTVTLGSLIKGPEPMSVAAPIGGPMVTFTCAVNTTDLPANTTFLGFGAWIVSGVVLPSSSTTNGSLEISTLQLPVLPDYITGVPIQCQIAVRVSGVLMIIRSNSATLTAYGKIYELLYAKSVYSLPIGPPEAPSNLTSTQSSDNALILSWSAPSSPVQLHYTVTVNISTTIRITNNTNITITREEVMTALNSSECDYYTFHVIASNPAGTSKYTSQPHYTSHICTCRFVATTCAYFVLILVHIRLMYTQYCM